VSSSAILLVDVVIIPTLITFSLISSIRSSIWFNLVASIGSNSLWVSYCLLDIDTFSFFVVRNVFECSAHKIT
jgi:hypothetical protein